MAGRPFERDEMPRAPRGRRMPIWVVRMLWTAGLIWLLAVSWDRAHSLRGRVYLTALTMAGILAGWQQRIRSDDEIFENPESQDWRE